MEVASEDNLASGRETADPSASLGMTKERAPVQWKYAFSPLSSPATNLEQATALSFVIPPAPACRGNSQLAESESGEKRQSLYPLQHRRVKSKGAPGLAFETWDPSNQFPLETPTLLFVIRSVQAQRQTPLFPLSSRTKPRDLQFTFSNAAAVVPDKPHSSKHRARAPSA